ncbi:MAG: RecX family transcriptional regulator [Bacteroidota bacterium]
MKITRITARGGGKNLHDLFVDGDLAACVSAETLLRLGLRTGDALTPAVLRAMKEMEEARSARNAALRHLALRPRTEKELTDRLRTLEFPEDLARRTVAGLRDEGLVDDGAFARMFIRSQMKTRPSGGILLRRKMLLLGVPPAIAREALQELLPPRSQEDAALREARAYLRRRGKKKEEDARRLNARLARHLASRGFTWDAIGPALRKAGDPGEEET